jgi:chromosome segregation ATPase
LLRAERIAEKERCRARFLEKDLKSTRAELEEALSELHEAEQASRSSNAVHEEIEISPEAGTPVQEETIRKLRREVGQLAKSRNDTRRRSAFLEQQLLEERRRTELLEQKNLDIQAQSQASPQSARGSRQATRQSSQGNDGSNPEWPIDSDVRRLQAENTELSQELRRARTDACRARAEVAPLKEENVRLSAEIRAILKSRLSTSLEMLERKPPWGAGGRLKRSQSARGNIRSEATRHPYSSASARVGKEHADPESGAGLADKPLRPADLRPA